MGAPGWLSRHAADVPPGDDWLCDAERRVQRGLRLQRRREDWRLGRWTAKCAVGAWLGIQPERIAALRGPGGAPEAWLDGSPLPVSLSISHRAGHALAVVGPASVAVGCDLELIEPRSGAFVREWLSPAEQRLVVEDPVQGHAAARQCDLEREGGRDEGAARGAATQRSPGPCVAGWGRARGRSMTAGAACPSTGGTAPRPPGGGGSRSRS